MTIADASNSLAEVVERLGNIDLARIRMTPAPGTASASDVASIQAHEDRLFELVDGILVEKVMGFRESLIAVAIARVLSEFVSAKNLGLVVGADGMMRLSPKTVRIPDVAFIAWDHLPGGKVPDQAVPEIAPSLAVEVLSDSNTSGEMARKRQDYFTSGVKLIWEIDIKLRVVNVYSSPDVLEVVGGSETLTAAPILPDLEVNLSGIFSELDRQPD